MCVNASEKLAAVNKNLLRNSIFSAKSLYAFVERSPVKKDNSKKLLALSIVSTRIGCNVSNLVRHQFNTTPCPGKAPNEERIIFLKWAQYRYPNTQFGLAQNRPQNFVSGNDTYLVLPLKIVKLKIFWKVCHLCSSGPGDSKSKELKST